MSTRSRFQSQHRWGSSLPECRPAVVVMSMWDSSQQRLLMKASGHFLLVLSLGLTPQATVLVAGTDTSAHYSRAVAESASLLIPQAVVWLIWASARDPTMAAGFSLSIHTALLSQGYSHYYLVGLPSLSAARGRVQAP